MNHGMDVYAFGNYATPLLGLREVVERLEEHVRHCPVGQYRVAEGGCWCE